MAVRAPDSRRHIMFHWPWQAPTGSGQFLLLLLINIIIIIINVIIILITIIYNNS